MTVTVERECGGTETTDGYPWVAYIKNHINDEYKCTAVLVADYFALTAAECVLHEVSR